MNLKNYIVCARLLMAASSVIGQDATSTAAPTAPKKTIWESSAAVGLTLTKGNSDTLMVNGNIQSSRKWDKNEISLGADGTYGENSGVKNSDSIHAFGQYNRLFTDRVFGYLRVDDLHDGIADIDYRFTVGPGAGYYFIKNADTSLRGEVGPGWVYEKQGGKNDSYITLRIAERFDHKLNDRVKLWQSLEFLPQVDDWNNFIINGEIGLEVALSKTFSQRTFLQDTYDNVPAPGRKENDLKLVAAIAYKF